MFSDDTEFGEVATPDSEGTQQAGETDHWEYLQVQKEMLSPTTIKQQPQAPEGQW